MLTALEATIFTLDPILQRDTIALGKFELCQLLIMNDSLYPWFVLVPERENIREIFELAETDQQQLLTESSRFGRLIYSIFNADKLNVAALGNVCPQLHIHHIVRYKSDPAWPAPIWGKLPSRPYTEKYKADVIEKLKSGLTGDFTWY